MRYRLGLVAAVVSAGWAFRLIVTGEGTAATVPETAPSELVQQVREGKGVEREDAIYALAKSGADDAKTRDALHEALRSGSWQERFLAAHALAEVDPKLEQAGPWLVETLGDGDRRVAAAAFEGLIECGGGKLALPSVTAELRSPDAAVRQDGCNRAGRMKDVAAETLPQLIDLVGHDASLNVRAEAAGSLGALGGAGAAKALLAAVHDADAVGSPSEQNGAGAWWAVRWTAIEGLVSLNPESPELQELAKSGSAETQQLVRDTLKARKDAATQAASAKVPAGYTGLRTVDIVQGQKEEAQYKNGVLDGRSRTIDAKGNVECDFYYSQGKLDGAWKWYFPDGKILMEQHYYHGLADGLSMKARSGDGSAAVSGTNRFGQPWDGTFSDFQRGADVYARGELLGTVESSFGDEVGFDTVYSKREGADFSVMRTFSKDQEVLARKMTDRGQVELMEGSAEVWDPKVAKWVSQEYTHGRLAGRGPLPAELQGLANPRIQCNGGMAFLDASATDSDMQELAAFSGVRSLRVDGRNITDAGLAVLERMASLEELELWSKPVTGAGLKHLQGLVHLRSLDLRLTSVNDDGMQYLAGLQELRVLILDRTQVTDAGLVHLGALKNLETLNLNGTKITDAGLDQLAGLEHLTELDLPSTALTDAGLLHLRPLRQHLEKLWISETKITDAGLATLLEFPKLKDLTINDTAISDAGMVHVGKVIGLEFLDLDRTKVTGAGLAQLANLRNLKLLCLRNLPIGNEDLPALVPFEKLTDLYLDNDPVTDAGMDQLAKVKSLTTLSLSQTPVTIEGIEKLKALLPKARIER